MSIILTRIQIYTITLNLIVIINTISSRVTLLMRRIPSFPGNLIAEYIASQYTVEQLLWYKLRVLRPPFVILIMGLDTISC